MTAVLWIRSELLRFLFWLCRSFGSGSGSKAGTGWRPYLAQLAVFTKSYIVNVESSIVSMFPRKLFTIRFMLDPDPNTDPKCILVPLGQKVAVPIPVPVPILRPPLDES
jgi:hypothetical protein